MPIGPKDLSEAELRRRLEREAQSLDTEDQARSLRVIRAMEAGATIDPAVIRDLDPAQLRDRSDQLAKPKG